MKEYPTKEQLDEILNYNPETGIFIWKNISKKRLIGKVAGCINCSGYICIKFNNKLYRAHNLALIISGINIPKGMEVDHINHIKSDNRLCNLRVVTKSENQHNRSMNYNNTSGCCGVSYCSKINKWQARITICTQRVNLGYFTNKEDAIVARKAAEIKYEFHENNGKSKV